MTKLEIIKENKRDYAAEERRIAMMEDGFERLVAEKLVLPWIKGINWLGGLSDSKLSAIFFKVFEPLGYDFETVSEEFARQIN